MSNDSDYPAISMVPADLRIAAIHPRENDGIDFCLSLAVVHTFLCPACPNVHLQVDARTPTGGKVRVGLRLTPSNAEELSRMLMFPEVLKEEDAEEGLS